MELEAAVSHKHQLILIGGNHNGDVVVYGQDGNQTGGLYSHTNSFVNCIVLSPGDKIASSDTNGVVQVWQLDISHSPAVRTDKQALQV